MDILEFAMKMELDGKAYYEKHARSTKDKELKRIFLLLAEEEEKHYNFFKNMSEGKTKEAADIINESSTTVKEVQNIFNELSKNNNKTFGEDEQKVWEKALEIEERTESYYREKAGIEKNEDQRKLLSLIADEERNHVHMIDTILTYMKFPEVFSESAQFKNFQSLEGH